MEEDIKFLQRRIELNNQMFEEFGNYLCLSDETVNSIGNLINKYKEQEKIIELMAFELATEDENYLYRSISDIVECFKKKAKGD